MYKESLLALLAVAREVSAASDGILPLETDRDELYPYDIVSEFAIAPNATGTWSFPGFDLSRLWSGENGEDSETDEEWNILMTVHGSYEEAKWAESPNDTASDEEGSISNPVAVYLRVPEDSFENDEIDENWRVCSWYYYGVIDTISQLEELEDDDDGTCAGLISESCLEDAIAAADDLDDCSQPPEVSCGVFRNTMENIVDDSHNDKTQLFEQAVSRDNGSTLDIFGQYFPYANADNEDRVREAYDEALTTAGPVIISYKYRDGDETRSRSFLRCARANNVAEGSREPEGFGSRENKGSYLAAPLVGALAVAIAAAICL